MNNEPQICKALKNLNMSRTASNFYERTSDNRQLMKSESTFLEKAKAVLMINKHLMAIVLVFVVAFSAVFLLLTSSGFYLQQLIPAYIIISLLLIQTVFSRQGKNLKNHNHE